jgi:hypothetical protein
MATDTSPTMRLLFFTSKDCHFCADMKKRKVVDLFAKSHPDVQVIHVDVDSPAGSDTADTYGVEAMPCLVFERAPDGCGGPLARANSQLTLQQLEQLHSKARKKLEA